MEEELRAQEEVQPLPSKKATKIPVKADNKNLAEPTLTIVEDAKNFQQARTYLLKNVPGLTYREVISKVLARQIAEENNISFPNWVEEEQ